MNSTSISKQLDVIEKLLRSQEDQPLSAEQAAKYLDVTISYLYKLTSSNSLPFFKPNGKKIYFRKQDLDKWVFRKRSFTVEELEANG